MTWVGVGAGAVSLIGGVMGSNASKKGAQMQADAANNATATQERMFNQTRDDQAPWRQAGSRAIQGMMSNADFRDFSQKDFQADPGYQFRMDEGQKALERSAAARGGLNSGGMMKALTRYGQDTASGEYQNAFNRFNSNRDARFNRLASVAGVGQVANNQVAQAGQNYANQAGQNMIGAANAGAAGMMGQANAWSGALSGGANTLMQYNMMNKMFPSAPAASGGSVMGTPSAGASYADYSNLA